MPRRFLHLPRRRLWDRSVWVALTWRARLLGLTALRALPPGTGLLLPRCRSVHTFGMRFALDLVWLDASGTVVRIDRGVPPGRLRTCRAARSVVELPAAREREGGDDEHGQADDGDEHPRREQHGRGDGQRDRAQSAECGGRERGRVLVGEGQVVDQALGAVALPAGRALPRAGGHAAGGAAMRAAANGLLLVEGHD
jgi:uncharacterized membrane protein (UPF0127 family)